MTAINSPNTPPGLDLSQMQTALRRRLAAVRQRVRAQVSVFAVGRALLVVAAAALLGLLLDWWLELSVFARAVYILVAAAGVAALLWRDLLRPLLTPLDDLDLAAAMDRAAHGHDDDTARGKAEVARADARTAAAAGQVTTSHSRALASTRAATVHRDLAPRVASVLQLPALLDQPHPPSPIMIRHAVARSFQSLERVDFREHLNARHLGAGLLGALLAIALPVMVAAALPPAIRGIWADRWLTLSDTPWPRRTQLHVVGVEDNRITVARGERLSLRVFVRDTDPSRITKDVRIFVNPEESDSSTVVMSEASTPKPEAVRAALGALPAEGEPGVREFRYDLPEVVEPMELTFRGGDDRVGPIEVVPVPRPRVTRWTINAAHPRGNEVIDLAAASGEPALLLDTDAELVLHTNVDIAEARLIRVRDRSAPAATQPATAPADGPRGFDRVDDRTFVTRWRHTGAVAMRVQLVSKEANLQSHEMPLTIEVRADTTPRVALEHSKVRSRVRDVALIPLSINARDDFGLRQVQLLVKAESQSGAAAGVDAAAEAERARLDAEAEADPAEGEAAPGPAVDDIFDDDAADAEPVDEAAEAGGEAAADPAADPAAEADADGEAGEADEEPKLRTLRLTLYPGEGESGTTENFSTGYELDLSQMDLKVGDIVRVTALADDDRYGGAQRGASRTLVFRVVSRDDLFREILLRQQGYRSRFRQARDNAKDLLAVIDGTAGNPETPQPMDLLRQHRLIQRSVWQVHQAMADSAEEMKYNRLGGDEAYRLMQRDILEPIAGLHDGLMSEQRAAMERLSGDAAELPPLAVRQSQTVGRMDQILRLMAKWDSFIDVVNQLNEIIRIQRGVGRRTERMSEDGIFED